jgi:carboxypeptidase Q
MRLISLLICSLMISTALPALAADEKVDLVLINKIRDEGTSRSKVMETLATLTDEIGPRLTGAPGLKQAGDWTKKQLTDWGFQNVRTESFAPFGRSWTLEKSSMRMVAPSNMELVAIPKAWTPGTDGVKRGKVVYAKLETEEDLVKWRGKLAGVILLRDVARETKAHFTPDAVRHSDKELEDIANISMEANSSAPRMGREEMMKRIAFSKKLLPFIIEEKVLATINASRGEDGTIFVQGGGSYKKDEPTGPSALVMTSENYNRIFRLVEKKKEVELEIEVKVNFTDEDPNNSINVYADMVGSDKKDEYVMLGAHLDSWHGGTGATDNGAGVAVTMEAMRILKAIGFKPRRTIRLGLWGGEEQGLIGSRDFIKKYVASRAESTDPKEKDMPSFMRSSSGPLELKPLHSKISAYYNLDNGTGKIRGIYAENNAAVKPIFDAWLTPFHDLGAKTTTLRDTGGTDHMSFDGVGVPGFQFIQDMVDYFSRTHHTNIDVYDKAQKGDLMQAAMIMASFVANTANRDEMLPRKPMPPEPKKENK